MYYTVHFLAQRSKYQFYKFLNYIYIPKSKPLLAVFGSKATKYLGVYKIYKNIYLVKNFKLIFIPTVKTVMALNLKNYQIYIFNCEKHLEEYATDYRN